MQLIRQLFFKKRMTILIKKINNLSKLHKTINMLMNNNKRI